MWIEQVFKTNFHVFCFLLSLLRGVQSSNAGGSFSGFDITCRNHLANRFKASRTMGLPRCPLILRPVRVLLISLSCLVYALVVQMEDCTTTIIKSLLQSIKCYVLLTQLLSSPHSSKSLRCKKTRQEIPPHASQKPMYYMRWI